MRSVSLLRVNACSAALVGLLVAPAAAQAPDPAVGTWKLNVASSKYDPGPPPKSATLKVDAAGKGYHVTVNSVGPDGKALNWSFTTDPGGKEMPVTGNPAIDTVSASGEPGNGTTTYKKAGKVVSTVTTKISQDGKLLTITTTGTDAQGRPVHNVAMYDKQPTR